MTSAIAPDPRLYVIARPALDQGGVGAFLADSGHEWRRTPEAEPAEELVELAGRVCYLSFGSRQSPRTNREYIDNLVTQGHHSVLEHAAWTFLLKGVSRAFTHQFVRHRVGFSYSQLSQQYHDERDSAVVMPKLVEADPRLAELWRSAVDEAHLVYREVLDALSKQESSLDERETRRRVRSAARTILPAATETTIAFTANARALRHFLTERGSTAGDDEMRAVSVLVFREMSKEAPALFADFRASEGPAGLEVTRRS